MKLTPFPAFLLLLLPVFSSCSDQENLIQPTEEGLTESVYASGTIKTRNQYQLYSTVSGIIEEVLVKEGDLVKKGSPIYKINNDLVRLNRENAQLAANYSAEENNRNRLKELKASLDFAISKFKTDSSLYKRQQELWNQGIGTRNELEQRELAMENAASNVESTRRRYDELERQIRFNAQQARKQLQITSTQQNDYIIKSESDGKVYKLLKEKGETVNPQQAIATMGDADNFILELLVDEYDIAKIKTGQKIIVTLDSYKGEVFEATLTRIDPIMDERTRSFLVEATFEKAPEKLYPNLSAEANIVIQTKAKTLTIPRNYLVQDSFVLLENKERRKVVTGLKDYKKVEILEGITASDKLVDPLQ